LSGIADFEEAGTAIKDYMTSVSMDEFGGGSGLGGVGIPMGGSAIWRELSGV